MPHYRFEFRLESARRDGLSRIPAMADHLYLRAIDEGYVLVVNLEAADAKQAYTTARGAAQRVVRLLALSYNAFRVTGVRAVGEAAMDAIDEQPWHPLEVRIRDEGMGRISMLSATARALRVADAELNRWDAWDSWSTRLLTALDVFYEAQCAVVAEVQLLLLMSVLDVLISDKLSELALDSISPASRRYLLRRVLKLLSSSGMSGMLGRRLIDSARRTTLRSNREVALAYFTTNAPNGLSGNGRPATMDDVKGWFDARNLFVHQGVRLTDSNALPHLNEVIGECIRRETGVV